MNNYIITPHALKQLLDQHVDIQLVDVRTLEKHQAFNIGGTHMPLEDMPARWQELDRSKPIITYCTSGGRSMRALQFLMGLGFEDVKSLDGGMTAWQVMGS